MIQVVPTPGGAIKLTHRLNAGARGVQTAIGLAGAKVRVIACRCGAALGVKLGVGFGAVGPNPRISAGVGAVSTNPRTAVVGGQASDRIF